METFRKYLKHLYLDDILYAALGGFIGSLLGVFVGSASFYQVGLFTLVGMIFSAYMVARKRMASTDE